MFIGPSWRRSVRATAPRAAALRGLRALRELLEDLARLEREIAEADALALAVLLLELDLTRVLLERREQRDRGRIAELGERLDRRGHGLGIGVLEEATEQLHAAGLAHLREQERQLGQRGAALREPIDGALDAERDLLEAIEREAFERLAGLHARLGRLAAEDVDEQIDDLRAVEIAEQDRDAREAERRLLVVGLRRGPRESASRSSFTSSSRGWSRRPA